MNKSKKESNISWYLAYARGENQIRES